MAVCSHQNQALFMAFFFSGFLSFFFDDQMRFKYTLRMQCVYLPPRSSKHVGENESGSDEKANMSEIWPWPQPSNACHFSFYYSFIIGKVYMTLGIWSAIPLLFHSSDD